MRPGQLCRRLHNWKGPIEVDHLIQQPIGHVQIQRQSYDHLLSVFCPIFMFQEMGTQHLPDFPVGPNLFAFYGLSGAVFALGDELEDKLVELGIVGWGGGLGIGIIMSRES